ncbi:hypothetical protein BDQ17DRAFT_1357458 [Cyathus striatus]|nr:hypothetical protein BDQ17DRAFT_1357458 [Cyathus striatus]
MKIPTECMLVHADSWAMGLGHVEICAACSVAFMSLPDFSLSAFIGGNELSVKKMSKIKASETFVPGRYKISRPENDSLVIDLSGSDLKSVIVFPHHGDTNQQWEIAPLGLGYSMRCVYNDGYVTVDNSLQEGVSIVATPYPVSWELEGDDFELGIWRICWPNGQLVLAEKTDGTSKVPFESSHLWRFVPVDKEEKCSKSASTYIDERSVDTLSTTKAETVIDAEGLKLGGNGGLSITTTTTTTTVTVTRVKRLSP